MQSKASSHRVSHLIFHVVAFRPKDAPSMPNDDLELLRAQWSKWCADEPEYRLLLPQNRAATLLHDLGLDEIGYLLTVILVSSCFVNHQKTRVLTA
jgi:hypothetical protein